MTAMPPRSVPASPSSIEPDPLTAAVFRAFREYQLIESPGCVHQIAAHVPVDAEERIVSALLCGHATLARLAPLRARDFGSRFRECVVSVFETFGATPPPIAAVALGLETLGFCGPIVQQLIDLRDGIPATVNLTDCIEEVREASRRRRMLTWVRRMESELAIGTLTADGAIARMRATFTGGAS